MLVLGQRGVEKREGLWCIVKALSYDILGSSQEAAVTSLREVFVTLVENQSPRKLKDEYHLKS